MKERVRLQKSESADLKVVRPEARESPSPVTGAAEFGRAPETGAATLEADPAPKERASRGHRFEQIGITERSRPGGGEGLPGELRSRFEGSLGTDFSRVRIHSDPAPDSIPARLDAHAVTFGRNVHVRPSAFQPSSPAGVGLLAHEMVHVAQQANATAATTAPAADGLEREPATLGPLVARGVPVRATASPVLAPAAQAAALAPAPVAPPVATPAGPAPAGPAPTGQATAGPAAPADVSSAKAFNPMDKRNRLINAIDSSDVQMKPAVRPQGSFGPLYVFTRHIKFAEVLEVFTDLTPAEAKLVAEVYENHEGRSLERDLFGMGESGNPSDLTIDQQIRLRAMLGGTVASRGASLDEKADTTARKQEAEAAEIHALLEGSIKKESTERIMTLLRRSPEANAGLAKAFEEFYQRPLAGAVYSLGIVDGMRANHHLRGDHAAADRMVISGQQHRIQEIDARVAEIGKEARERWRSLLGPGLGTSLLEREKSILLGERRQLVQDIETRVQGAMVENRELALDQGADLALAEQLAQSRALALVGGEQGVEALGGADAIALRAVISGDPVAKVSADLLRAQQQGKLTAAMMNAALRDLREQAEARVKLENPFATPDELEALGKTRAAEYFEQLKTTHDRVSSGPVFEQLVAGTGDTEDAILNLELLSHQGKLSDIDELVQAVGGTRKDIDTVERVLRNKSAAEIDELKQKFKQLTDKDFDFVLFGDAATRAGAKKPDSIIDALQNAKKFQGKATGDSRLQLEDYVQRPGEEGGLVEVGYIKGRAEREYEYAIDNRGFTGAARDWWGNEQRTLLDETIKIIRGLHQAYTVQAEDPEWTKSPEAIKIIENMRMARATIRGDRHAYEKATAELAATFQAIAAFAIQIALSAVLGPLAAAAGRLVQAASMVVRVAVRAAATYATNAAATVGSNLIAYADEYSLDRLKGDLLGAAGSPLGPMAVGKFANWTGGWIGKKLSTKVSAEFLQLGRMVANEGVELGKSAAGMKTGAWAQGEDVELSLEEILKNRGMDIASSKLTEGVQKATGLDKYMEPAGHHAEAERNAAARPEDGPASKPETDEARVSAVEAEEPDIPVVSMSLPDGGGAAPRSAPPPIRPPSDAAVTRAIPAVSSPEAPVIAAPGAGKTQPDGSGINAAEAAGHADTLPGGGAAGETLATGAGVRPRPAAGASAGPQKPFQPVGVKRQITDPVEAAQLFRQRHEAGEHVRILSSRDRAAMVDQWQHYYGQTGDPPIAWIDANGTLVFDPHRVPLPIRPADVPSGPVRQSADQPGGAGVGDTLPAADAQPGVAHPVPAGGSDFPAGVADTLPAGGADGKTLATGAGVRSRPGGGGPTPPPKPFQPVAVSRQIHDPVEAGQLLHEHHKAKRHVRLLWSNDRALVTDAWHHDYGQTGDPPIAWIDANGTLVVTNRVPAAFQADAVPSGPVRQSPDQTEPSNDPAHATTEPGVSTPTGRPTLRDMTVAGAAIGKPPARPDGLVTQAPDPKNLVDAYKLYREHIRDDPRREAAILYNHVLDEYAVIQGDAGKVDITTARRQLGWPEDHVTVAEHSHPVGKSGGTPEHMQVPSGRGADVDRIAFDAAKRSGTNWHAIHVTRPDGTIDRTWVVFSPETGLYTVDYPDPGERGGRGQVTFRDVEQYHEWYRDRFGLEPGKPKSAEGANAAPATVSGTDAGPPDIRAPRQAPDDDGPLFPPELLRGDTTVDLATAGVSARARNAGGGKLSADAMVGRIKPKSGSRDFIDVTAALDRGGDETLLHLGSKYGLDGYIRYHIHGPGTGREGYPIFLAPTPANQFANNHIEGFMRRERDRGHHVEFAVQYDLFGGTELRPFIEGMLRGGDRDVLTRLALDGGRIEHFMKEIRYEIRVTENGTTRSYHASITITPPPAPAITTQPPTLVDDT
jgi:hypothetical protein